MKHFDETNFVFTQQSRLIGLNIIQCLWFILICIVAMCLYWSLSVYVIIIIILMIINHTNKTTTAKDILKFFTIYVTKMKHLFTDYDTESGEISLLYKKKQNYNCRNIHFDNDNNLDIIIIIIIIFSLLPSNYHHFELKIAADFLGFSFHFITV